MFRRNIYWCTVVIVCQQMILSSENGKNRAQVASYTAANASIAIVGAGFAGLSAAHRLLQLGFTHIDVFEASDRIGGRVYPVQFEDGYLQMGAEFIDGSTSPLYEIAQKLNIFDQTNAIDDIEVFGNANSIYAGNCKVSAMEFQKFQKFADNFANELENLAAAGNVSSLSQSLAQIYAPAYASFLKSNSATSSSKSVFDALSRLFEISYFENEWSGSWTDISLKNYDEWDVGDDDTEYGLNKIGFKAILDTIVNRLPTSMIRLNNRITNINYVDATAGNIRLSVEHYGVLPQVYSHVIVTVALGHLKRFARQMFAPPLPAAKLNAIDQIGFGNMAKVFLVYRRPFWRADDDQLIALPIAGCSTFRPTRIQQQFVYFTPLRWQRDRVLVGWLTADAPTLIDTIDDAELAGQLTDLFRAITNNRSIVPPDRIIRQRWTTDPLFLGSYSYISKAAAAADHIDANDLAMPIVDARGVARVLFAGEATHATVYQTTTGAYLSGIREAERIDAIYR